MHRVGLFLGYYKDSNLKLAHEVCRTILNLGGKPLIQESADAAHALPDAEHLPDEAFFSSMEVALSLGGDGTLLSASRKVAPYGIPVLGINLGHLGFLSELERDDFHLLSQLFRGEYVIENRMRLQVTAARSGEEPLQFSALNDAVISRGFYSKLIDLEITADGNYLNRYTADGIIIATPTGSTAYSLSAGGPVIEPDIEVFSVVPVCPHSIGTRPLVLSSEKKLTVQVESQLGNGFSLSVDGDSAELPLGSEITIQKSPEVTRLIRMKNRNFYDVLRHKLS